MYSLEKILAGVVETNSEGLDGDLDLCVLLSTTTGLAQPHLSSSSSPHTHLRVSLSCTMPCRLNEINYIQGTSVPDP
jgi:hypothetical protein